MDFVDVDFPAGFDVQYEVDGFCFRIGQRLDADFAVGVACGTHTVLDGAQNFGHLLAFVPFAGFHGQQLFQFGFRYFVGIAFNRDFAPAETFAFVDGDFDGLLGFVFVGLDVGIEDTEVEIAVVLVEIGYFLHILGEFLTVELVAPGQPRPNAGFGQGHLPHQFAVGIDLVAFKFDVGDFGGLSLVNRDVYGDTVA